MFKKLTGWLWGVWAWYIGTCVSLRICHYDDGELDEIFLSVFGVCVLHLEKMDTNSWWMGLYATKVRMDTRSTTDTTVNSVYIDRPFYDTTHVRWICTKKGDVQLS